MPKTVETQQLPLIEEWPVRDLTIDDLFYHADFFLDWLDASGDSVVGFANDGRRCPFHNYLVSTLGGRAPAGMCIGISSTGLHDCSTGSCGSYRHIQHPPWLSLFIGKVDRRKAPAAVTGRQAALIMRSVLRGRT